MKYDGKRGMGMKKIEKGWFRRNQKKNRFDLRDDDLVLFDGKLLIPKKSLYFVLKK